MPKSASHRRRKSPAPRPLKPSESRRGFLRVDFEPRSRVTVGTREGKKSYDALDLSVYGLSFLASPKDAERFAMGMPVPMVEFELRGHRIRVHGRVAYMRTGLIAGLAKVAIEFLGIHVDDVWFLARYVAEKAEVQYPKQIGSGLIQLNGLRFRSKRKSPEKKARRSPKARKKTSRRARKR